MEDNVEKLGPVVLKPQKRMPKDGKVSFQLSALELDRNLLLRAADQKGLVFVSAPKLAEIAGVSTQCSWKWLKGCRVRRSSHEKILRSLGLD